ncbi:MAG: ABC transporter substrate-binding protein [Deltaproteobacteria bacterium]|nr:ABC transporter substrate-binding protein [Deltaproteobacteria bacterium]
MKKLYHCILVIAASLLFLCLFNFGATAAEKVQTGGTLTFADMFPRQNPRTWDNGDWNWRHGYDTGYYIEHLLVGDLQKGPRGTKKFAFQNSGDNLPADCVRGELVEKWEVKKEPLSIVFTVRKGIMWQEKPGVMKAREFVADDIVNSMNRLKSSRKATPYYYDFIDRLEAKDKYTVIAHLKEWNAEWPYYMGYGYYDGIQALEQDKGPGGAAKWENACGTGPFMLEEYKSGHSSTYVKNPNYWDSDVINGQKYQLPLLDKAISMFIKDPSTQLAAIRTGKLDMVMRLSNREMQELKKTTPELIWSKYLDINSSYIALRMDRKPFDDVRVRRAVNMSIDRDKISNTFSGGETVRVMVPFPPSAQNVYTPLEKLPPAAKELFTYNPEKAKKLLAEAGYPNGFTFKCTYGGGNSETIDFLSMIAAMLAEVGVTMEIDVMSYPSALSKMTKKVHENGYLISATQGTPLAFIRKTFLTKQTWNASMMSDPYIDKTWERLSSDPELTQKQIDSELKKLGVYIIEQAPMLFLDGAYNYCARWPWVKNYYGELRVGAHRVSPIIARIWIDQELKKKMGH